jgi:hypothetical protein
MRMFRQREAELSQKSRAYEEAKASGDKWAAARAMGELQVAYQRFQAASDIAIKNLEDRIALNDKLRQEQEQAEQNRQLSRIAQAAQQQSFTDRFVDDIHQGQIERQIDRLETIQRQQAWTEYGWICPHVMNFTTDLRTRFASLRRGPCLPTIGC